MRKHIWIPCIVILAICFWFVFHRTAEIPNRGIETQVAVTNQQFAKQSMTPNAAQTSATSQVAVTSSNYSTNRLVLSLKDPSRSLLVSWQGHIDFYGRVVDESNSPVPYATASFHWVEIPSEEGNRSASIVSDANGFFALTNQVGLQLGVSVSKAGYYSSRQDNDTFNFGSLNGEPFRPNPMNPVVFHLRKKGEGVDLIRKNFPPGIGQIWQLHHDGTPIELDLINGNQNVSGSGQLKLEFWRDISNLNKQPFDWKLQMTVLGGGIIPTSEEFAFTAPETGYQSFIVIDMPATNQNWINQVNTKYYVHLPNGDYGRVEFYLLPDNGAFTAHSAINPTGLRNLEQK